MWTTPWLLLQLMISIIAASSTTTTVTNHLYCPLDSPNRFYGNVNGWVVNFDEYPVPLNSGTLSQKIDACTELGSRADKLQAGITKEGSFASAYCTLRCAFTLVMGDSLVCAERRLPMQWTAGFVLPSRMTTKVDCSNMSLPFTVDKYPENRVILQFSGSGLLPMDILSTINSLPVDVELLHLPLAAKLNVSVYKSVAYNISKSMDTITKIAITNDLNSIVDPTPLLSILTYFPNVAEFSLNGVSKITSLPDFLKSKSKLKALRLENNGLKTFPTWAMNLPNLQFLKVSTTTNEKTLIDPSFISKLNLPALEHFIMIGNNFSVLPSDFLATSTNLIQLDLSCNLITTLPSSLAHLANLKFLYLAGNLFRTLPPTLIPQFPKLMALDVARQVFLTLCFLSGNTFEIGSAPFICRSLWFSNDSIAAQHPGIESFNKSHLANAKNLKVLNINGNMDILRLDEGIFEQTPKIKYISMRRIGFPSLIGLGLCGLCNLEFLEVSYNQFQSPNWIEEACGLGWPTISYIGLAYVNLTYSSPTLALMALSSESMYSKIEYFFYTNPIFNNTCELADFYSMVEGTPSWRSTPVCLTQATQKISDIAPLRNEKYSVRPCSITDSSSSVINLFVFILILCTIF